MLQCVRPWKKSAENVEVTQSNTDDGRLFPDDAVVGQSLLQDVWEHCAPLPQKRDASDTGDRTPIIAQIAHPHLILVRLFQSTSITLSVIPPIANLAVTIMVEIEGHIPESQ